jgi:hypothetical protein
LKGKTLSRKRSYPGSNGEISREIEWSRENIKLMIYG